jgi:chitodextrinase
VSTDTTPPSVPSDVSATSTLPTQATVSWTASTDAVGVIGYHVWRGDSVIATTTSTSFTDSGLWPDAPYSYTVSAFDAAGNESARSAPASVTTLADTNPPSTPTQLSQTAATETTATLRWHASTDDVAVTGYQYYGATASPLGTTPDTSVTYTGLACGTSYVVGIVAFDEAGNLSPEATTTLTTAACGSAVVTLDKRVTWHQFANRRRITSPPLTTAQPGELVVAFIGSDGPATIRGVRFSSVTGGGLSWTLRKRVNTRYGTSEIWTAPAFDVVANMTVTATRFSGSYVGSITVAAFRDASLTGVGATGGASATSGAPSASLLATETGSVVWGVGNDWDRAVARTQGVGQTVVDQFVSSSAGCTFWVQRRNATSTAGQTMTIRDRAPTSDQWNLATIEIVPAGQSNA